VSFYAKWLLAQEFKWSLFLSFDDENASTWGKKNEKHKIPTHLIKKKRDLAKEKFF